jgi:hypothetical protein
VPVGTGGTCENFTSIRIPDFCITWHTLPVISCFYNVTSSRDTDGVPGLSEKENKMCKSMEKQFMKIKKRKSK